MTNEQNQWYYRFRLPAGPWSWWGPFTDDEKAQLDATQRHHVGVGYVWQLGDDES